MSYEQTSPGRSPSDGAPAKPAEAPAAPAEGAPGTAADAGPPQEPPSLFSGTTLLIFALPLLLVFFTMRSQAKKQKQVEESLKVGEKVVTRAGLLGKVVDLGDRFVKVEIAPGVVVQVLKGAIEAVDAIDSKKADDKGDAKKDDAKKDDKGKGDDKKAKEKAKDK